MRKSKKEKNDVAADVVPTETVKTNSAVFTEYPSVIERSELKRLNKNEATDSSSTDTKEPAQIEQLFADIKNDILESNSGLNVNFQGGMILIVGNNGMHCYGRVQKQKDSWFHGEFLAFTPAHHLKTISEIFEKRGVVNKNKTFLSPSGMN